MKENMFECRNKMNDLEEKWNLQHEFPVLEMYVETALYYYYLEQIVKEESFGDCWPTAARGFWDTFKALIEHSDSLRIKSNFEAFLIALKEYKRFAVIGEFNTFTSMLDLMGMHDGITRNLVVAYFIVVKTDEMISNSIIKEIHNLNADV